MMQSVIIRSWRHRMVDKEGSTGQWELRYFAVPVSATFNLRQDFDVRFREHFSLRLQIFIKIFKH